MAFAAATPMHARVQAVRCWSFGDVTRVVIQTEGVYRLSTSESERPVRTVFQLSGAGATAQVIPVNDRRIKQIRVLSLPKQGASVVFDLKTRASVVSSRLVDPDRLIIEFRPYEPPLQLKAQLPRPQPPVTTADATVQTAGALTTRVTASTDIAEAVKVLPPPPPAPGVGQPIQTPVTPKSLPNTDRSLVRVLGLKATKIVIDAGHGGHDTGTIGPDGLLEKDLVLDVALRLGQLVTKKMGAQVIYTRNSDVFIPLEERTRIAQTEKADLFISIHANSSPEHMATGVETYYFNLTSDKAGLDLATRENATSASSISELNDLLHKAVLQTKLEESRQFAQAVQSSLWTGSLHINAASKNRGVRQAPFVVLIGATMPSILTEIGFLSNPHDERLLKREDDRERIAESLYKGIEAYSKSLNRTELARAIPR